MAYRLCLVCLQNSGQVSSAWYILFVTVLLLSVDDQTTFWGFLCSYISCLRQMGYDLFVCRPIYVAFSPFLSTVLLYSHPPSLLLCQLPRFFFPPLCLSHNISWGLVLILLYPIRDSYNFSHTKSPFCILHSSRCIRFSPTIHLQLCSSHTWVFWFLKCCVYSGFCCLYLFWQFRVRQL